MFKRTIALLLSVEIFCTAAATTSFADDPPIIPSSINFSNPAPNQKIDIGRNKYIETFDDKLVFHNIHPQNKTVTFARDFNNTFANYISDFSKPFIFLQEGARKAIHNIFQSWQFNGIPLKIVNNENFNNWLRREFAYYLNHDDELAKAAMSKANEDSLWETIDKTINNATEAITEIFPTVAKGAGILSATYVASKFAGLFGDLNNFRYRICMWFKNMFSVSRHRMEDNPEVIGEEIEKHLNQILVGQSAVISKIAKKLVGHFEKIKFYKKANIKENSPCIMCFAGDSGNGKSAAARAIAEKLCKKPIYINPQMLKIDNSNEGKSPIEQLFGTVTTVDPKGKKMEVPTELATQIAHNNEVVIVFEEWDKMHKFDPNGSIDEFLRQVNDNGYVKIGKEKLHFPDKSVIILTTNESMESLEKGSALGRANNDVNVNDATGARTVIGHDQSFLFRMFIAHFKSLDASDLFKIATPKFKELEKYYKKQYSINVSVSDNVLQDMAISAVTKKKGARGINEYIEQIGATIVGFRIWCKENKINYKNKAIKITFNKDKDEVGYQKLF